MESAVTVPVANMLPPIPPDAHRALSSRELDYLARLALNDTRKGIAARDGITADAVSQVVNRALDKLGADSLIEGFRRLGWLKPGGTW